MRNHKEIKEMAMNRIEKKMLEQLENAPLETKADFLSLSATAGLLERFGYSKELKVWRKRRREVSWTIVPSYEELEMMIWDLWDEIDNINFVDDDNFEDILDKMEDIASAVIEAARTGKITKEGAFDLLDDLSSVDINCPFFTLRAADIARERLEMYKPQRGYGQLGFLIMMAN